MVQNGDSAGASMGKAGGCALCKGLSSGSWAGASKVGVGPVVETRGDILRVIYGPKEIQTDGHAFEI